ncbi:uncharacterized protein V6R79_018289 [Siganus canaliculatus]
MTGTTALLMALTGLSFPSSCLGRLFILVEKAETWEDARSYCREKYTDLASILSLQHWNELLPLLDGVPDAWIGLHADADSWRWSEGDSGVRLWAAGEPNGNKYYYKLCVALLPSNGWADQLCDSQHKFFCSNGSESSFVFVNEPKTWDEAQRYCREHYVDLVTVRNKEDNSLLHSLNPTEFTWIGLFKDSWKWSDGSALSFSSWATDAPSNVTYHICGASGSGGWLNRACSDQRPFLCYSEYRAPPTVKRVVRVVLKKSDPTVDLEELKDGILQKFSQRLKDYGLSTGVKLRWVKQSDGKVFKKKRQT